VKVLHVINSLGTGGAERSLSEMLSGFVRGGIASEVVVFQHQDAGVETAVVDAGIPVHILTPGGRVRQLVALRRLVRDLRPDVIHTTVIEADILGRLSALGRAIPVVTSLVNTSYSPSRIDDPNVAAGKLKLVRLLDGFTARHLGSGFHAVTQAVRSDAIATLGLDPGRITVIPRGRSADRLGASSTERRRQCRAALDIDDAAFLVVNVGRQEYQKGQSTLLEAVALLRSAGIDLDVLIAGREGNETRRLIALAEQLDVRSSVAFLGHIEGVPDLLAAADVLVFPSRFEGLGGAVVEALALETPIVASDVPALREVLDDGRLGWLVPVDDPRALADAVDAVRRNLGEARARSKRGRSAFRELYTLDRATDAMAAWFTDATRPASTRTKGRGDAEAGGRRTLEETRDV
jgi:glycosyltransferase involved in cell wall biosynthesis